jgi:hypothetical protein
MCYFCSTNANLVQNGYGNTYGGSVRERIFGAGVFMTTLIAFDTENFEILRCCYA